MNIEQYERVKSGSGFIAALDQSGGSTPKALKIYGIPESSYAGEAQMFDVVHQMRTRIILSPSFGHEMILAAILFEMTMERQVDGLPTAQYLWSRKGIVPFLKIDNGLLPVEQGVALMKPIPQLAERLSRATRFGIFGTKARSVIQEPSAVGISRCVDQQFEIAEQVLEADLIPIIEPEVDIESPEKAKIEEILKGSLIQALDALDPSQKVILKLTLPSEANFYSELISHPRVLRVAALSGGYSRVRANELLAQNAGMIASFSRALTEGLDVHQSDKEFDETLRLCVESIFLASTIKRTP